VAAGPSVSGTAATAGTGPSVAVTTAIPAATTAGTVATEDPVPAVATVPAVVAAGIAVDCRFFCRYDFNKDRYRLFR
jgi:hypothetical protein